MVIIQAILADERRAAAPIFGNMFLASLDPHFVAQFGELRARMPQRDDVSWCNRHDVFWLSGYCDSQARNFGGDTPKFQQIAGHNGSADFSCREGNEHVVHGTKAVGQSRGISI
jgi:hypothetical protein